jgi:His-Xaa-Ser repeat protein HxsA
MKPKRFLISSLILAGLLPPQGARAAIAPDFGLEQPKNKATLFEVFKRDHVFDLAAHRSHSSHRSHVSHSSHSSHRSSTTGGYSSPVYTAPVYTPQVNSTPIYTAPAALPPGGALITLPGNTSKFTSIVLQVQTALYAYGYFSGPLTGVVDPATKLALSDMQAQFGLPVTGKITPDVLDALSITAE